MSSNPIKNVQFEKDAIWIRLLRNFKREEERREQEINVRKKKSGARRVWQAGENKFLELEQKREQLQAEIAQLKAKKEALISEQRDLEQALERAKETLEATKQQREEIRNEAWQEGIGQGRKEGRGEVWQAWEEKKADVEKDVVDMEKRLEQEKTRLQKAFKEALLAQKEQLREILLQIVERIVRAHLSEERLHLLPIIHAALEKLGDVEKVKIKVHPHFVSFLEERKKELQKRFLTIKQLVIIGDESFEKGDVQVEAPEGFVDATISRQLKESAKVLS